MKIKPFRDWNENTKALLIRAWAAGAVCFFGAWGRQGADGSNLYSLNLIGGLIFIIIAADWILVNPVIRMAFNTKPKNGPGVKQEKKSPLKILGQSLFHIFQVTTIVIIIVLTYYGLNRMFIALMNLDESSVPVPLEPILFGILYAVYYFLFDLVVGKIKMIFTPKEVSA